MTITPIEKRNNQLRVLDTRIDTFHFESLIRTIISLATERQSTSVLFANVHMVVLALEDEDLRQALEEADIVVPDGWPIAAMARSLGAHNQQQIRGPTLMPELLTAAARAGRTVGFLGSTQETIDRLKTRAEREISSLKIAYAYSPPFRALTRSEWTRILDDIKCCNVEILFVGLGCPKQEKWIKTYGREIPTVTLGVGAAFDFYAGTVPECPHLIRKLGLEWLYRITQQPLRLAPRYLTTNPIFILRAAKQLLSERSKALKFRDRN